MLNSTAKPLQTAAGGLKQAGRNMENLKWPF